MAKGRKIVAVALVATLLLPGCAATQRSSSADPSAPPPKAGDDGKCLGAAALAGGLGALAGALLTRDKGGGAVIGGLIGAGVGAMLGGVLCLAVTSEVEQAKPAEDVESEYMKANQGQLPSSPEVKDYRTLVIPESGTIAKGENLVIKSHASVIQGQSTPITKVQEDVQIKLDKDVMQTFSKEIPASSSGEYNITHTVRIPPRFQDGTYTVLTRLQVNGQEASKEEATFRVATRDDGVRVAMLVTSYVN